MYFVYLKHCSLTTLALLSYDAHIPQPLHVGLQLGHASTRRVPDSLQQGGVTYAQLQAFPGRGQLVQGHVHRGQ